MDAERHKSVSAKLAAEITDPDVDSLVTDVIGQVADKWTMILIDLLALHGVVRFKELERLAEGISQKMLSQTLRKMERQGLVERTVYPVVPPRVEYRLTDAGLGLGQAFCEVWKWAETNLPVIQRARQDFDNRANE